MVLYDCRCCNGRVGDDLADVTRLKHRSISTGDAVEIC